MLTDICVLLTGAGAPGAPGIIKCLRKNGERDIRIVGVDMNENATGRKLVDAFYKVPAGKDPAFLSCILDICKKESVQVVMPLVTRELSAHRASSSACGRTGKETSALSALS